MFHSLRIPNYRRWAGGALVSNIGTWMQRTAQDWLVLTGLSHHSARAVGIVMALQFAPQILLIALSGFAADRLDRRRLLFLTQGLLGALALALGLLTLGGAVRLWQVYGFAFALGCVTAFDTPARQAFVAELVGEADLANAVALNSTSFNLGRLIGPALAGLLISAIGSGWVFLINAASFAAVILAMTRLRSAELHRRDRASRRRGALVEGFRYVWRRRDLRCVLFMLFLIGTFGLNFPIFISTMSVSVFHADAGRFGLLSSMMAAGAVAGALLAARRARPAPGLLFASAGLFGIGCAIAALMPAFWLFGAALVLVGIAAQTVTTSANSYLQLSTEPAMRGRVIAILLAAALGGTPLGAPLVGWVADHLGPRWALGVGALAGLAGAACWLLLKDGPRMDSIAAAGVAGPGGKAGEADEADDEAHRAADDATQAETARETR
ncbi:MFS transporter [Burkholderia sp. A1]|uniref:MFS transporter n=1 Tax=Burkholderia sp. A1 TaxID=148446 RepID=UPI000AA8395D|nr:MFS transporter [Burkholderia sp. A1]